MPKYSAGVVLIGDSGFKYRVIDFLPANTGHIDYRASFDQYLFKGEMYSFTMSADYVESNNLRPLSKLEQAMR